MIRLLKILEYSLSSISRRRFKNISIIATYSLTVAILASILLLTHSLKEMAGEVLQESPAIVVQRLAGGRHELIPEKYSEKIGQLPGVGEIAPRVWGYYYDSLFKANYTIMGFDGAMPELKMLEGRGVESDGECVVGSGVAGQQNAEAGDALFLVATSGVGYTCEITGIFTSSSSMWTNDLIVFTNADLRRFFSMPEGMATDITVGVYNENEVANIAEKIRRLYPDTRPIMKSEILHTYSSVFNWRSGMMLAIFTASLVAFCLLAWDKASGISGDEKREIGILKAIGWSTGDILTLKFFEGSVLSLGSFVFGIILAYIHVFILDAPLFIPVLQGWSVLFPRIQLVPYIDVYQVVTLASLTVIPYMACTVIPSWKSAITDPDSVMRGG